MIRKTPFHLYRKHFTRAERRLLKAIPENDVTSEVNVLRVQLGRLINSHGISSPADLKLQLDALRTAGEAASMIAGLVRTQIEAHNPDTELKRIIEEALLSLDPYDLV
jgi:hypothetical protein